jgi:hypothetical protein
VSLYREAGRGSARTLAVAVVIALVAGLGIGYAIGHSSAPEPSATELGAKLRNELRPVKGGLVLIPNEYAQAYKGEGVEAQGVQGALARIEKDLIAAAPDLRALDPKGVEQLDIAFDALKKAVSDKAPPAEVKRAAERTSAVLATLPGGS